MFTHYNTSPSTRITIAPTMLNKLVPVLAHQAFPLHLKYPKRGYHNTLLSSLFNNEVPIYKWSKKVT